MANFFIGLFIGVAVGIFIAGLAHAAAMVSRHEERAKPGAAEERI
jgi:hypothetical protein